MTTKLEVLDEFLVGETWQFYTAILTDPDSHSLGHGMTTRSDWLYDETIENDTNYTYNQ